MPMIKPRKIWYSLGRRGVAPILFPCKIRKRCFFVLNNTKAFVDKSFYEIYPKSKELDKVLCGILNSTITLIAVELHGRFYGRGLLELEVYELKQLPILNPNKLSDKEKEKIENAFLNLLEAQKRDDKASIKKAMSNLDEIIFDILNLSKQERKQVYDGLDSLRNMRLKRKKVKVLVETEEGWMCISVHFELLPCNTYFFFVNLFAL